MGKEHPLLPDPLVCNHLGNCAQYLCELLSTLSSLLTPLLVPLALLLLLPLLLLKEELLLKL